MKLYQKNSLILSRSKFFNFFFQFIEIHYFQKCIYLFLFKATRYQTGVMFARVLKKIALAQMNRTISKYNSKPYGFEI
jgi:hypothetical protein